MKQFLLFLLLFPSALFSQNITIEGAVFDHQTQEALSFANVYVKGKFLGCVTNANGQFKIIVPQAYAQDSLTVSYIGYLAKSISIGNAKSPVNIGLSKNLTTLNEVVIKAYTAKSIIEKAIKNIPINNYESAYVSTGFYRVTSKSGDQYLHLSEAVFDQYQSRNSKPDKQIKLQKVRAIKDEEDSHGIHLGLSPNSIFSFDFVHNLENMNLFNKKGFKNHVFNLEGTVNIDGKDAYKISFDQREMKKPGYKGCVYIDRESFAFLAYDFGLSPIGLPYYVYGDWKLRSKLKLVGIDIQVLANWNKGSYKEFNGRYYLNKVENKVKFQFKNERNGYDFIADTQVDFIVSDINISDVEAFGNDEILSKGKLIERQNSMYDPDFWKEYNIILATEDFNKIAKDLEAKNEAYRIRKAAENN